MSIVHDPILWYENSNKVAESPPTQFCIQQIALNLTLA